MPAVIVQPEAPGLLDLNELNQVAAMLLPREAATATVQVEHASGSWSTAVLTLVYSLADGSWQTQSNTLSAAGSIGPLDVAGWRWVGLKLTTAEGSAGRGLVYADWSPVQTTDAASVTKQRATLLFNQRLSRSSTDFPDCGGTAPTATSGDGVIMPRAGSVVGVSVATDVSTATSGVLDCAAVVAGTVSTSAVASIDSASGTGIQTAYTTLSSGVVTFAAGESVVARMNPTGTMTWDDTFVLIEVEWN